MSGLPCRKGFRPCSHPAQANQTRPEPRLSYPLRQCRRVVTIGPLIASRLSAWSEGSGDDEQYEDRDHRRDVDHAYEGYNAAQWLQDRFRQRVEGLEDHAV